MINLFLRSKFYENLNPFFAKKIFKLFKIFFIKADIKELPNNNYTINKDELIKELDNGKYYEKKGNKPYLTYVHLIDLISVMKKNETFNFFDYGAGNLNLYYYLKKKIKDLNYFFLDQPETMAILKDLNLTYQYNNFKISKSIGDEKIDLVYFGSTLQYIKNYKKEIAKFKNNTKYLLISQTPFFNNNNQKNEHIVLKQVNMHPNINYLYSFNYDHFISFMEENNFELIEKNLNRVTKFLNFKNFKNEYKDIDMYDLFFKKIK